MSHNTQEMAKTILYEWWYAISEALFERVCEVTELDEDQRNALRAVSLRPNDFHLMVEGLEEEQEEVEEEVDTSPAAYTSSSPGKP